MRASRPRGKQQNSMMQMADITSSDTAPNGVSIFLGCPYRHNSSTHTNTTHRQTDTHTLHTHTHYTQTDRHTYTTHTHAHTHTQFTNFTHF